MPHIFCPDDLNDKITLFDIFDIFLIFLILHFVWFQIQMSRAERRNTLKIYHKMMLQEVQENIGTWVS